VTEDFPAVSAVQGMGNYHFPAGLIDENLKRMTVNPAKPLSFDDFT